MYREFYGLKERPFSLTPDPKFLYLSDEHKEALNHLLFGITQKEGFMLLTGEVGVGKTTLCRSILEKVGDEVNTALIINPVLSEDELILSILQDFGVKIPRSAKTRKDFVDLLNSFLISELSKGKGALLIVDEAQDLTIPVLEQLRLLSNLETEKEKLLQIILVGQEELSEKMRLPELRQLNQRISIRYHIGALSRLDTERYIYHRLMIAGSDGSITFTKGAIKKIYEYSKGIPRLINLLAERALLAGYAKQTKKIDKSLVLKGILSLEGREPKRKREMKAVVAASLLLIFCVSLLILSVFRLKIDRVEKVKVKQNMRERVLPPKRSKEASSSLRKDKEDIKERYKGVREESLRERYLLGRRDIENGFYFVHVASFRQEREKEALKLCRLIEKLGYAKVGIRKVDVPKKGLFYRVVVYGFENIEDAVLAKKEFQDKLGLRDIIVVRVRKLGSSL